MANDFSQNHPRPPRVSVIVPTCNRGQPLRRCLASLAAQSIPDHEVIVIDDGSRDDTAEVVRSFAAEHADLRLIYLANERNLGANPSRNRGIRASRGEFVAFIDDDCVAEPDWLQWLLGAFDNPRVAAVTGRVIDRAPRNIYELTLKGNDCVAGSRAATRLVSGNMCLRRQPLLEYLLDEDPGGPGRCDEEGLYLKLGAAGYEQLVAPQAQVTHDHAQTGRSFFRLAYCGGRSAARLVYKFHLPTRLDMLPFLLAYATLPLAIVHPIFVRVAALFFCAALAAITYNDLVRKRKTAWETLITFPLTLAYYHVRLCGYVLESVRLRLTRHGLERFRLSEISSKTPANRA